MAGSDLVTRASPHVFSDTVARLEAGLDQRGLTVFARVDHAAGARGAGLALRPTLLLVFGDALGGTPLMQSLPTLGLDLPLRMLVFEGEAGVNLAWRDPAELAAAHGGGEKEASQAAGLGRLLEAIAADVVSDSLLFAPAPLGEASVHDKASGFIQAQVATGGQAFFTDEAVDQGGGGAGPSPHDLLSAALAACTTMTLRLYADRKGWPLVRVHVAVDHRREPQAARPDLFRREIELAGPLDAEQKQRLHQIADRCPVHRTLTAGARIETRA